MTTNKANYSQEMDSHGEVCVETRKVKNSPLANLKLGTYDRQSLNDSEIFKLENQDSSPQEKTSFVQKIIKICENKFSVGEEEYASMQYNLGLMYAEGIINYSLAMEYFEIADKYGHLGAKNSLGVLYLKDSEKNSDQGIRLIKEAADLEYSVAQNNLGLIYAKGISVDKNYPEAKKWFKKAANQEHAGAQNNLGVMYEEIENFTKARELYEKSAKQKYAVAKYNLGLMYTNGIGVTENLAEARKLFEEAKEQGHEKSKIELDKVLKKTQEHEAQVCNEPLNGVKALRDTEERKKNMGMDAPIDLVEQFKVLSQEEQEYAMSCVASFREKAEPSPLDQLKATYIKFPEKKKTTVDNVLAHLKPQLKDYVVSFGAKEDSIYLDDLREVEPLTTKMYQAFYRAHKRDSSSPLLSDLIPKQTEKTAKRLENYKFTETTTAKEYTQIESAKKYRRRMAINDSHNAHTV